jgi:hypothetical protein
MGFWLAKPSKWPKTILSHGKVKVDGDQRNITIERNIKQKNLMQRLESAFLTTNICGIKDIYVNSYN